MNEIEKERTRLLELYKQAGAEELKLKIYYGLITECARAQIQLDQIQEITAQTGLIKIHPNKPELQKTLPVASELSKLRASLTNMLAKLDKILCVNTEDDEDDLEEFE